MTTTSETHMESRLVITMQCLTCKAEPVQFARVVLAETSLPAITTIRPARCGVCSAPTVIKCLDVSGTVPMFLETLPTT